MLYNICNQSHNELYTYVNLLINVILFSNIDFSVNFENLVYELDTLYIIQCPWYYANA